MKKEKVTPNKAPEMWDTLENNLWANEIPLVFFQR
jgi:hypothetical protein